MCTKCNLPYKKSSKYEHEIISFINDTYKLICIHGSRKILTKKELDIYIPEKKLAIEFNGLYWHNELLKEMNYHLSKTEECEKRGIRLIHIFEDEWKYKKEIVKSRLQNMLGKNDRIFARKTKCKMIDEVAANDFLNINHIEGACPAEYHYGLFYNNELAAVMTFGKNKNEFELLRFANKLYINVVGGASKLFSHFIKDHPEIEKIVSYADRRWPIGNFYEKLNFIKTLILKPKYFYINNDNRYDFLELREDEKIKQYLNKCDDVENTLFEHGIYKIYDCGNIKFEYYKK